MTINYRFLMCVEMLRHIVRAVVEAAVNYSFTNFNRCRYEVMRFRIIRQLRRLLRDQTAQKAFAEFVELRQRIFSAEYGKALCLDRYDLVADHIIVYENLSFKNPIAYMRSVTSKACEEVEVPLPIVQSISHSPVHMRAFSQFMTEVSSPVHMSFLCLDKRYKAALDGFKLVELLTWVAFQVAGPQPSKMGYCSTPNSKFHLNAWIEIMGKAVDGLPKLTHPVIPDPHELILIPKIRESYWKEQEAKFGSLLSNAQWLVPAKDIEQKHAA